MVIILNRKKKVMKSKLVIILALILLLTVGIAEAQVAGGRHPESRVAQGTHRGEITRFETKRLINKQHRIHRHARRAKSNDAHIGPSERRMLAFEKNNANRYAYRYKHNRFERF